MKTLTVNGVRLATVDRGSGPPVLLVHGFPLDHSMWEGQIEALSGRFRVIAPDLRGFGQSGERCLPSFPDTITMDQFADDLAALVDALGVGGPVVLCGLSMGGYIAFAFCRKYPARLRGLILCDTRAAADAPEAAAGRLETAERVLREGPGFVADSMLPKLLAPDTLAGRPEIVAAVRKVILATDPRGIAAALRGMRERPDSTPLLAQIACPTLVVVGQEDGLSPPETMQALARQVPNSRFVTIPGAGHLSPVEQPAATTAAITGFLDSLA